MLVDQRLNTSSSYLFLMPLFGVKTTTVETTKLTPRSLEENHAAQGVVNWASELIGNPKKELILRLFILLSPSDRTGNFDRMLNFYYFCSINILAKS